ncbi:MAG TPA: M1 family metallopeptidase [Chitinophagaceae bacterium]|nr:M1 family metallopeptidase [Chitinophagaceae bacterium]
MRRIIAIFIFIFSSCISFGQFTKADTLRGSINADRDWWDVMHYTILVTPDFLNKKIEGKVDIKFKVLYPGKRMQIDLQQPLVLTKAFLGDSALVYTRDGNVYYLDVPFTMQKGSIKTLALRYSGDPIIAKLPPWDGGWIFKKDIQGRPWMSVACQGLGASAWYPCKDHQGDEPDNGAKLRITIPDTLVAVGNGHLTGKTSYSPGTMTWDWEVKNPINNYNIVPYIGKYVNFKENYKGEKGDLELSYWVLDYNLEKAKQQFTDVPRMMKAFEYWFGPYPFYEDGYKLVDAPHLGMEHQSAVAYGNAYKMGYSGRDLSGSGWGLKWDYIIVHESGHEWFANNITTKDIADMWVHEGFTDYSETLFTEYYYGKKAGTEYTVGLRRGIRNDKPIIGPYGVNKEGSGDMYNKGNNILHTIRYVINDDEKFRKILRGLNKTFYHQTVTSKQVENYISKNSGKDLSKIFDQYLRTTMIPTLEYKIENGILSYRWTNVVNGFNMPVKVTVTQLQYETKKTMFIYPTENFKELRPAYELSVDENFYVKTNKVN